MTPLPIAFPDDGNVYGRENERVRGYEWMIGDSLLAAPLYGDDYENAIARDVYLPRGSWIDYDTGRRFEGRQLLKSYSLPPGKTALFVGGSGIVIEKRGTALVAMAYPVTSRGESVFIYPDGLSRTTIRVNVSDWKKVSAVTSNGRPWPGTWVRHAFEFAIAPGQNYELR
jgi:alpha-glucosidase (family GH31 glycosyl hydrolase)